MCFGRFPAPVLDIGQPGSFNENGVLACSVVDAGGNRVFMYYVGFELGTKIRYRLLTGLAISENGRGVLFPFLLGADLGAQCDRTAFSLWSRPPFSSGRIADAGCGRE